MRDVLWDGVAAMKRTPLRRRTPLIRRTALRARRAGIMDSLALAGARAVTPAITATVKARRDAVRAAFERDGYRCQAADLETPGVQCGGGLDGHEPLTRARGGDPLDPDQIVTVCRHHHRWIHANPIDAHDLGLLRHSWEGPAR